MKIVLEFADMAEMRAWAESLVTKKTLPAPELVKDLDMPQRTKTYLAMEGLTTVKQLLLYDVKTFEKVPGIGTRSLAEVELALYRVGIDWLGGRSNT